MTDFTQLRNTTEITHPYTGVSLINKRERSDFRFKFRGIMGKLLSYKRLIELVSTYVLHLTN